MATPPQSNKRQRGTPTGSTPQQTRKQRTRTGACRNLGSSFATSSSSTRQYVPANVWSSEELKALLEFVLLNCESSNWPNTKNDNFWKSSASFVKQRAESSCLRTGGACRYKVVGYLQRLYSTPKAAEIELLGTTASSAPDASETSYVPETSDVPTGERTMEWLKQLPSHVQIEVISNMYKICASTSYPGLSVPSDFLELSLKAMSRLKNSSKSNILHGLARGLGTLREDGSDSLIPIGRMPFGLLEYVVDFFQSSKTVKCPDDYRLWLESMYCLFGTKWTKLHNGPMWSSNSTEQDLKCGSLSRDPVKARVNIPGLSSRSLQMGIASKDVTVGTKIQYAALDEANRIHPGVHWWIKGDGCDVVEGLGESVSKIWNGDVDMADGKLAETYAAYRKRLDFADGIGLPPRNRRHEIASDLQLLKASLSSDLDTVSTALTKATQEYNELLGSGKGSDKAHYRLGWKVDDLSCLNKNGRKLILELSSFTEKLSDHSFDLKSFNLPRKLTDMRKELATFVTAMSKHTRIAATHIFVFMISPGKRNSKPYAIPIQYVSYRGMTEGNLRALIDQIVHEMHHRGMKVDGFVTNGEFNKLRSQGYKRPISVIQIKANVRKKYSNKGETALLAMLTPMRMPNGDIEAVKYNEAVPDSVLSEIFLWRSEGATDMDVITRLRLRTVPSGFKPHPWSKGNLKEGRVEMLRSILAQMEYSFEVCKWDEVGVPFRTYMYVPEVHHITKEPFLEREDEGHVFKRIGTSTRMGGPDKLKLERYVESLEDHTSGLTYPALTGQRKQSVTDVERLFCPQLLAFMRRKNYLEEANYIQAVLDWRMAHDERGLSELQRCRNNYSFLNYILDDFMPWHKTEYDFSLLEVNRSVSGVCGFTRETLIALTTNIEGREFQRCTNVEIGYLEHPRASTTDDVECFFSLLRDNLGKDFTLKHVQFEWRKCCLEFMKRMDPSLPFYYFTSAHDRFYEGPRPDFSQPSQSKRNPRNRRSRRIEQPGSLVEGRVTLPVPGSRSLRMQFHNLPVDMPPPPNSHKEIHTFEHSY